MTVLPGVLGYRILRRTFQVRLGSNPLRLPGGTPICTVSRHRFVNNAGYNWSGRADLNRRPPAPKAGALTRLRYVPKINCAVCLNDGDVVTQGRVQCKMKKKEA